MTALERRLDGLLHDRKGKGRYRQLREYDPDSTLVAFVRNKHAHTADNQSSNDYLSLTDSATLRSSFLQNLELSPRILGSTGSRLLSGSTSEHTSLEQRLRLFFDSPSALPSIQAGTQTSRSSLLSPNQVTGWYTTNSSMPVFILACEQVDYPRAGG